MNLMILMMNQIRLTSLSKFKPSLSSTHCIPFLCNFFRNLNSVLVVLFDALISLRVAGSLHSGHV